MFPSFPTQANMVFYPSFFISFLYYSCWIFAYLFLLCRYFLTLRCIVGMVVVWYLAGLWGLKVWHTSLALGWLKEKLFYQPVYCIIYLQQFPSQPSKLCLKLLYISTQELKYFLSIPPLYLPMYYPCLLNLVELTVK